MASMLRISASPLLPPSRFPFSASFFRPPPLSSLFLWIAKALHNPRHSRGFSPTTRYPLTGAAAKRYNGGYYGSAQDPSI